MPQSWNRMEREGLIMTVLCLGDIVGEAAVEKLQQKLWGLRKLWGVELCIANGENACDGNGISPSVAESLFSAGVDVLTSGNHVFRRKEIYAYLDEKETLIRPANYPAGAPGQGYTLYDMGYTQVLIINLLGQVYMDALDCPFRKAEAILNKFPDVKVSIIDFHAEATSEKKALAIYLEGKVSAVVGTHTHVQTADATVLPGRTAFMTDLGMTGPVDSILGIAKEPVLRKFLQKLPVHFEKAEGEIQVQGALLDLDETTGKAKGIKAVSLI